MSKPTRSEKRILKHGFFLDRDVTVRAAKQRMVTVRKEHPCAIGPLVGRDDCAIPIGARALTESLKKLRDLPDETTVFPGHGPETTIGIEKRTNYFLRRSSRP